MTLSPKELEVLRTKREAQNGRRAHYMCGCGCPISAELEQCPNCRDTPDESIATFGVAILDFKRAAKKERLQIRKA